MTSAIKGEREKKRRKIKAKNVGSITSRCLGRPRVDWTRESGGNRTYEARELSRFPFPRLSSLSLFLSLALFFRSLPTTESLEQVRGAFHLQKNSGNFGVNFLEFLYGKKLFHFAANFACVEVRVD